MCAKCNFCRNYEIIDPKIDNNKRTQIPNGFVIAYTYVDKSEPNYCKNCDPINAPKCSNCIGA